MPRRPRRLQAYQQYNLLLLPAEIAALRSLASKTGLHVSELVRAALHVAGLIPARELNIKPRDD